MWADLYNQSYVVKLRVVWVLLDFFFVTVCPWLKLLKYNSLCKHAGETQPSILLSHLGNWTHNVTGNKDKRHSEQFALSLKDPAAFFYKLSIQQPI